jgi:nucleoside-triphosphatase THEP1
MKLGYISIQGRGETDRFLAEVAAALQEAGLRLAGTVQTNTARDNRRKCDMDLIVLPDGPTIRISEDRGALARGCILDSEALEQTVFEVARRLEGADLLIVNKFGKREGEGRGLIPVIGEALARDIPVLVGVNGLNLPDFLTFAEGLAEVLPTDVAQVADWCNAAARKAAA